MTPDTALTFIKRFIPTRIFRFFQPAYHWLLALVAALVYRFPSRKLRVVAVTGTKGKSTTTELLNAVLEEAGYVTALSNTIRHKIAGYSERNMSKTSLRGRFFVRRFLRQALKAGCDTAIIEMTSEGARQFRHKWVALDGLLFTNLSPEHIESHGSYENYRDAKLSIARSLKRSSKDPRTLVVNADDKEHGHFVTAVGSSVSVARFSLKDAAPYRVYGGSITFTFKGERFTSPLTGEFNLSNILAALTYADVLGVDRQVMKRAIQNYHGTPGRVEYIHRGHGPVPTGTGQSFDVVVDYAHTPDSLEKLYKAFDQSGNGGKQKRICVLGNTGGGRDTWKRSAMGEIADQYCDRIILTNEDPYDEDPKAIVQQMKDAITETPCEIIMDRRKAIRNALRQAQGLTGNKHDVVVLITGKGTDPYIMEANNTKTPWSDAEVVREELEKIMKKKELRN